MSLCWDDNCVKYIFKSAFIPNHKTEIIAQRYLSLSCIFPITLFFVSPFQCFLPTRPSYSSVNGNLMSFWPCLSHSERSTSNSSEENQTDVCLKRTSVQTYPRVKWGAKYNETPRKFLSEDWKKIYGSFMYVRSSLSRQLDTNFLLKKG